MQPPKKSARCGRGPAWRGRGASTPESRRARGPPCTRTRSRFEAPSCRGKVHRVACKMWHLPTLGACTPAQVTLGASRRVRRARRTARTVCLTCLSACPVHKGRCVPHVCSLPLSSPPRAHRAESHRRALADDSGTSAMRTRLRRGVPGVGALAAGAQVDDEDHK